MQTDIDTNLTDTETVFAELAIELGITAGALFDMDWHGPMSLDGYEMEAL